MSLLRPRSSMTGNVVVHRSSAHPVGGCRPRTPPLRCLEGHLGGHVRYILGLEVLRCEGRSRRLLLLLRLPPVPMQR